MRTSLLLFAALSFSSAQAQFTLKPKAGVTLSRLDRPNSSFSNLTEQNMVGWQAGAALTYAAGRLSVQGELLYNTKGTHLEFNNIPPGIGGYGWTGFRFHYLELPLLAHYNIGHNLHLGAGAYYARLLHTDYYEDAKVKAGSTRDHYSKSDFGLVGELTYRARHLEVGARYSQGLSKVQYQYMVPANDPEYVPTTPQDLGRNRGFQFYVAVPIRL